MEHIPNDNSTELEKKIGILCAMSMCVYFKHSVSYKYKIDIEKKIIFHP